MGRLADSRKPEPVKPVAEVKPPEPVAPIVEPPNPPEAKEPEKKEEAVKVKKTGGRKPWLSGVGLAAIVLSIVLIINVKPGNNMMVTFFMVLPLISGGFAVYYGFKKGEEKLTYVTASGKPIKKAEDKEHPVNSLNIYPNYIEFEWEENPQGAPWQHEDDGKFYFVHLKSDKNTLKELALPDDDETQRYYDPTEYGNVVTMPLNKKYFSWSSSTARMIAMGIMAVIIIAEIIGLIASGG